MKFGQKPIGYDMTLNSDDRPWCPQDNPEYLCVLRGRQQPPVNLASFLDLQNDLLDRLVKESNQGELEDASRRLRENLPLHFLVHLPGELFSETKARETSHC